MHHRSTAMHRLTDTTISGAMRLIAKGLAAGRLQISAAGLEHIPVEGPALVVARHYHHLFDGLALFAALRRPFHIVVTLDWVQSYPAKYFMRTLASWARWPVVLRRDAIVRSSLSAPAKGAALFSLNDVICYQRRALHQAVELLVDGRILVVFPEGYPNIDPAFTPKLKPEEFLPFKRGFVSIIDASEKRLGTKLPIIPLGIHYHVGKPCTARLAFGEAIYRDQIPKRIAFVEFVEKEVKRLSKLNTDQHRSNHL
jgi:1-acyl-sn-glycerol-3-phosphate acyltransferase